MKGINDGAEPRLIAEKAESDCILAWKRTARDTGSIAQSSGTKPQCKLQLIKQQQQQQEEEEKEEKGLPR